MSACENNQGELSAYLDGELPDADRAACEAHVRECANCQAVLQDLQTASAAVSRLPRLKAPPALAMRLRQEVLVKPPPADFSKFDRTPAPLPASDLLLWRPVLVGIAALVILCTMAFLMLPAISMPAKFRTALVAEGHRKAATAPALASRDELRKAKESSARVPSETVAPAGPAAEAPDRVDGDTSRFKTEAAARKVEAVADKISKAQELEPAAPAAAVAAPPAPPAALAPSAPFPTTPPGIVAKSAAPGRALEDALKRRAGMPLEEAVQQGNAVGRGGEMPAGRAQDKTGFAFGGKAGTGNGKAAEALADKLANGAATAPKDSQSFSLPRSRNTGKDAPAVEVAQAQELVPTQEGGLGAAQQRPSQKLAGEEGKQLAKGVVEKGAFKPGGFAGEAEAGAKAMSSEDVALKKTTEASMGLRNRKDADSVQQKEKPSVFRESPSAQDEIAAATEAKSKNGFGQAKGGGAAYLRAEPQEVLVFRTQDPQRLIGQLRELAVQNGARWEGAELSADRKQVQGGLTQEAEGLRPNEAKVGQASSLSCAIVTAAGQQRRDILAKLRQLQALNFRGSEDQLQRSTEQQRTPAAERGTGIPARGALPSAAPETGQAAQQELKPAESRQLDGGKLAAQQPAEPATQTGRQGEKPEARIPIRIDIFPIPAK